MLVKFKRAEGKDPGSGHAAKYSTNREVFCHVTHLTFVFAALFPGSNKAETTLLER